MNKSLTLTVLSSLMLGHLSGQSPPDADEVLKRTANNYTTARRLLISGRATFEGPDGEGIKKYPFMLALELPDKFHIDGVPPVFGLEGEFSERSVWVADGSTTWTYESGLNTYNEIPRSSPPGSVGIFKGGGYPPLEQPEQVVAYLKMNVPGWSPHVLEPHRIATITGSEVLSIHGKATECFVLQSDPQFLKKADGTTRETLWIDQRRFVAWRRDELMWANNGLQYLLRIDLATVKLNTPLAKNTFVFRPPKGSKMMPLP